MSGIPETWLAGLSSHHVALGLCIVLVSGGQILLKMGALRGTSAVASFLNPVTLTGYGLYLVNTILVVYAMQQIDLKVCSTWTALTYLLVVGLARALLKERVTQRRLVGCVLILIGVYIFQMS